MNQIETTTIITVLNRAGLVGALEGQAAVWAEALDDVRFEDGREATRQMIRTRTSAERWVTPGDIRTLAKKVRLDRFNSLPFRLQHPELPQPTTGEWNPRDEITFTRAYRDAVLDGKSPEIAYADACRAAHLPVTPLIEAA
ncbi:hypothetical protein [Isoptericola rhizosphaerae]|uniref:hypothetical protein n=1 Tax=Isoptericola rhizosphaerae TaxID=3377837 RepID=UPI003839E70E